MQRIYNSLQKGNIYVILMSILLTGFIAFLVGKNYLAQSALQKSTLKNFQQDLEKRATAVSYFYSERKNDLKNLAASREITMFFENQALGMSMEYGLRASLMQIQKCFAKFLVGRKLGSDPIYHRLVFLDREGKCLVDSNIPNGRQPFERNWDQYLGLVCSEPAIVVEYRGGMTQVMISLRYCFQNSFKGQIIAYLVPETVQKHLIQGKWESPDITFNVFYKQDNFYLNLDPDAKKDFLYKNFLLLDIKSMNIGEPKNFTVVRENGVKVKMMAIYVPIQETPFFLLGLWPESKIDNYMSPWQLLATLGLLSFLVLGGLAVIWRTNTNNVILQVKLEETSSRKQELEEKNQQLLSEVAQRQQAEEELIRAKEKAEEASRAKSQFLANMSHEIRTPIHGVLGNIELLLYTSLLDAQLHYAKNVEASGKVLLKIVEDILELSKIEDGLVKLEKNPLDLSQVLHECLGLLHDKALAKGLTLTREISQDVPRRVNGDSCRLQQVLINLIDNAIKFTDTGGIQINVKLKEDLGDAARVLVEVIDSGVGIAPEARSRIFESFHQVDGSMSRRYGGAGLGLAIVKQLVEAMGGKIEVTSKPGNGTTFSLDLLLDIASDFSQVAPPEPDLGKATFSGHVLLVEDNVVNQEVALGMLTHFGCRVDVAANGQEALEATARQPYDLILMDCQMPEVDGYQATKVIREKENGDISKSRTPIVALTAHAMEGDLENCLAAGMDGYISKPFTKQQLQQLLAKWLPYDFEESVL
jgi:signal transduction histidine kinase/ActR/RegA family two-component response regulator